MKILITQSDRQVVMYAENIIYEDDIYYAWNDIAPHKVTRANTREALEIVTLPNGVTLPDDEYIIGKYVYTIDDTFEIWSHWEGETEIF